MNIEQVIREYIPGVFHMSLATSKDNKPWVCEVHFAYDDDLNLYFVSIPERRHSLEIAENPFVSGNIIEPHSLTDKPRGVYFEGTAERVGDIDKDHPAFQTFFARIPNPHAAPSDLYKITVTDYYVFDARESKPSEKYHLSR